MTKTAKWIAKYTLDIAIILMLAAWLHYRDKPIINLNLCPITESTPPSLNNHYRI